MAAKTFTSGTPSDSRHGWRDDYTRPGVDPWWNDWRNRVDPRKRQGPAA